MTPAEKIRYVRQRNNITQTALADALNISPATICKFERGQQNLQAPTLWKICEYFNRSDSELDYADLCREMHGRVILPPQIVYDIEAAMTGEMAEKICAMLRAKKMEAK